MEVNQGRREWVGLACERHLAAAWRQHAPELLGFVRRRLGDAEAAKDVTQDVFLRAMRIGEQFCALDNPRAWLYEVARNATIDWLRRRAYQGVEHADPDRVQAPASLEPVEPIEALTVCLPRVLRRLDPDDADVLVRCDLDEATARAYSLENNLSLAAAKARLHRARKRLRQELMEACRIRLDANGAVADFKPLSS